MERISHGLYGLIIVTATLVAEQHHIEDAVEALALLLTTALVLLLAHVYSTWMAERTLLGTGLDRITRHLIVLDNLPVLLAIVVPCVLLGLAAVGFIELIVAYTVSIVFTLLTLFGLGVYAGRSAEMGWRRAIASGLAAVAIGAIVVIIEAFFD